MTTYTLIKGATVIGAAFSPSNPVAAPSQLVQPTGVMNPNSPPPQETVQGIVTGTGSVSGTVKVMGSNDGVTWVDAVATVTISSATTVATAASTLNTSFTYYTAYVSAISGTSATLTAIMSA